MVTASDGPVDEEILTELFMVMDDSGPEDLIRVCDLFLTGVPARLSDIGAALAEGRMDDAAKAAHSLKGTAGAFGARRLGQVAGRLEQECLKSDGLSAAGLSDVLQAEYLIFKNILEMRLAALSSTP
jgi:HPt (histidine-containing phosphotransfer) domain-containing protein